MLRNLLYNCCPIASNNEWKLNLDELGKYANAAFNGRRIVVVRQGKEMVKERTVRDALSFDAEVVVSENDKTLCETYGFVDNLALLESKSPDEATFYAHTKGVFAKTFSTPRRMQSIQVWRNTMYERCLSDIPKVEEHLSKYACTGCFQMRLQLPDELLKGYKNPDWAYTGTFWWVQHKRLFEHPQWRKVPQVRHGVEMYLGLLFDLQDAGCLYNNPHWPDLYNIVPAPYGKRFFARKGSSDARKP